MATAGIINWGDHRWNLIYIVGKNVDCRFSDDCVSRWKIMWQWHKIMKYEYGCIIQCMQFIILYFYHVVLFWKSIHIWQFFKTHLHMWLIFLLLQGSLVHQRWHPGSRNEIRVSTYHEDPNRIEKECMATWVTSPSGIVWGQKFWLIIRLDLLVYAVVELCQFQILILMSSISLFHGNKPF